jgi:branched-chain amino acid transport system substrate-binding protein
MLNRRELVAAIAFAAAAPFDRALAQAERRIGVLAGLTGGGAQIGQWMLQGAEVAVEVLRKRGGPSFVLVGEDTQWNAQKGVEGFNKLTTVDRVDVLLAGGSAVMEAIAPIADQRQIVIMNTGAQSPKMAGIGKFTFSVLQLADFDIQVLARFTAEKLGLRQAGMLYINNDTGKFNQAEFSKAFQERGGKIVAGEAFRPNETNYGAQLAKISAAAPDCIYVVGTPAEMPFAVKQTRALMPKTQILSYAGLESQEFISAAGEAANGIVYTTTYFDPSSDDPVTKEFVEAHRARFGSPPVSPYLGYGYDAVMIIAEALTVARAPGEPLRAAIAQRKRFPGVAGESVFREDGTVAKAIAVKKIEGGRFQVIDVVKP